MYGKGWRIALLVAAAAVTVPIENSNSPRLIEQRAAREGTLTIYSTTDAREAAPLLDAFKSSYPFLTVRYAEISAAELYDRFLRESREHNASADLLWSAAMDLQIKLVNDGHAQAYVSPERPALPDWAIWKDEAFGVTAEPIVFAYNNKLVPPGDVPRSHAELLGLLRSDRGFYRGKIASYDPSRSGSGFLYLTWDLHTNRDTWELVDALGSVSSTFHETTKEMLDRLSDGRSLIAYNLIGSYALDRQARDPSISVILPEDYTLIMSRIAIIPRNARHPDAAKLFLDFLLSRRGQSLLASRFMTPVRSDVAPPGGARAAQATTRAIRVGPVLLVYLDQLKRRRFLADWRSNLARSDASPPPLPH